MLPPVVISRYLHSVWKMVRISVLKFAEIGVFEGKVRMSANLGKRGLFSSENSRKSEKGYLVGKNAIRNMVIIFNAQRMEH